MPQHQIIILNDPLLSYDEDGFDYFDSHAAWSFIVRNKLGDIFFSGNNEYQNTCVYILILLLSYLKCFFLLYKILLHSESGPIVHGQKNMCAPFSYTCACQQLGTSWLNFKLFFQFEDFLVAWLRPSSLILGSYPVSHTQLTQHLWVWFLILFFKFYTTTQMIDMVTII